MKAVVQKYLQETQKIKEEYKKLEKYIEIDGNGGPDAAYRNIKEYL